MVREGHFVSPTKHIEQIFIYNRLYISQMTSDDKWSCYWSPFSRFALINKTILVFICVSM